MARRAIGIVRVSQTAGREGDSFVSPRQQRHRIEEACKRDQLTLLRVLEELDVSGGTPLHQRDGLRTAIEAVETGEADVIVAAYFDRLVRSIRVQDELLTRVENAGGQVLAVDVGRVSGATSAHWLSAQMIGTVSEYFRRSSAERSADAQARAVARGVVPWPRLTPGYRRGPTGVLEPDPVEAKVVRRGFEIRAEGGTVQQVRDHLARHGIIRSYHGTSTLLKSRVVLGEIHFGNLVNLTAHEPIVSRELWDRVQRTTVPRGRRAKSQRLLARLEVLRCATCESRMVVGSSHNSTYWLYRCPPNNTCPRRAMVSAPLVEDLVTETVRTALRDVEGRASVETQAREAEALAERAQADLDAAIRAFTGLETEPAAIERLTELRAARDEAVERAEHLGSHRAMIAINAATDWDRLTLDARRRLIRAVVRVVWVDPGRGPGRITVELHGE